MIVIEYFTIRCAETLSDPTSLWSRGKKVILAGKLSLNEFDKNILKRAWVTCYTCIRKETDRDSLL